MLSSGSWNLQKNCKNCRKLQESVTQANNEHGKYNQHELNQVDIASFWQAIIALLTIIIIILFVDTNQNDFLSEVGKVLSIAWGEILAPLVLDRVQLSYAKIDLFLS